ncbi:hypothetical protein EX30DRAFT_127487 [Ascodesmis nigricans]|uniref:Uncharacterized protein n=1 Tax=Ascodesmis nigricans TaxID=341454 RepID=A0A4S2MRR1_9PEZI|nr:hypothetical protein EX30DRAFT_127487 [Ascodesmis nigricans]
MLPSLPPLSSPAPNSHTHTTRHGTARHNTAGIYIWCDSSSHPSPTIHPTSITSTRAPSYSTIGIHDLTSFPAIIVYTIYLHTNILLVVGMVQLLIFLTHTQTTGPGSNQPWAHIPSPSPFSPPPSPRLPSLHTALYPNQPNPTHHHHHHHHLHHEPELTNATAPFPRDHLSHLAHHIRVRPSDFSTPPHHLQ